MHLIIQAIERGFFFVLSRTEKQRKNLNLIFNFMVMADGYSGIIHTEKREIEEQCYIFCAKTFINHLNLCTTETLHCKVLRFGSD